VHGPHTHGSRHKHRLLAVFALTAAFLLVEASVGLWTGSLSLLADATHMLVDAGGVLLSLLAVWFAERPATPAKTYGYYRVEILAALARSPGRVLSRETLLEHVWGDSEYRDPRTVDVHIRHLREKLESDPKEPEFLFTVRGVGYRFRE